MNQPTEDRIKRLEEKQRYLEEEVRQLREQITEPIRIDHLEIDRGGTQELLRETNKKLEQIIQTQTDRSERLEALERGQQQLLQEIHNISHVWFESLQSNINEIKQETQGTRSDVLKIRESQADFKDKLETMASKDDLAAIRAEHGDMLRQILDRLPPKQ
jgi:DNA repair exonuclease SbcCD ATPase subunit